MFLFSKKKKESTSKRSSSPFDRNNAELLHAKRAALEAERAQFVLKSKEFVRPSIALHRVSFVYCQPLPGRMSRRRDEAPPPTTLMMADYDISEVAFRQFNNVRQGQRLILSSGPRCGKVVIVVGVYGGRLVTQEYGDFPREFDRDDTFAENAPIPLANAVDVALPTYPFDGITVQGKAFNTNGVTMISRYGYLHGTRVLHRTGTRIGSTGVILGVLPDTDELYEYNEVAGQCLPLKGRNRSDLDDAHGFAIVGFRCGNPGPVALPTLYEFPVVSAEGGGSATAAAFDVRFSVLQSHGCGPHGQVVIITRGPRYGTMGCIVGVTSGKVYCLFDAVRGAEWMDPDLGIVPIPSLPARPLFFSRTVDLPDVSRAGLTTIARGPGNHHHHHRRSSVASLRSSICESADSASADASEGARSRRPFIVNYPAYCGWMIPINSSPDACHRFHLFHGQRVIFGLRSVLQDVFVTPLDEVRGHNLAARGWRLGTVLGAYCDEMWLLCDDTKLAEPLVDSTDFASMTAKYVVAPFERDTRPQFDIKYSTSATPPINPHHFRDPFLDEKSVNCTVATTSFRDSFVALPLQSHLTLFRILQQAQLWMFDTSPRALAEVGAQMLPSRARVRRIARIPPKRRSATDDQWDTYAPPQWFTVIGVASGALYALADDDPSYAQRLSLDGCVAVPPGDPDYRDGAEFVPMLPSTYIKNPRQERHDHLAERQHFTSGSAATPYVPPKFTGDTRAVREAARTAVTKENQREMGLLFGLLPPPCRLFVAEWLLHCFGIKLEESENLYDAYGLLVAVRRQLPKQQLPIPTLQQWRLQELAHVAAAEQTARLSWEHEEAKCWRQAVFRHRSEEHLIIMSKVDTEEDFSTGVSRLPKERKNSMLADRWKQKVDYKFLTSDASSMFLPKNHKPTRFFGHNYLDHIKSFMAFEQSRRLTFDKDGFPNFPPSDDDDHDAGGRGGGMADLTHRGLLRTTRRPVTAGGGPVQSSSHNTTDGDDDGDGSSSGESVIIEKPKYSQALSSPYAQWKTVGTGSAIAAEKRIHLRPVIRLAGMAAASREVALDVSNKPQPKMAVDTSRVSLELEEISHLSACTFPFPYITSAGTTMIFDISVAACAPFGMYHGQVWLVGRGDSRGKEIVILGVANNQLWRYSEEYDAAPFHAKTFEGIVADHQLTPVRDFRTVGGDTKIISKPRDCDPFFFIDFRGEVQHFITSPEVLAPHQVRFGDRYVATAGSNVMGAVLTIIGVFDGKLWYARDWSGARPHEGTGIIQDFGLRYLYNGAVNTSVQLIPDRSITPPLRTVVCSMLGSRSGFASFDASETSLAAWGVQCGQQFVISRGPQASHQGTIVGTHWGKLYRLIDGERHVTPFEASSIQNFSEVYELHGLPSSPRSATNSPHKVKNDSQTSETSALVEKARAQQQQQQQQQPLSKLAFAVEPIIERCPLFVQRQCTFRFRVRSGDILHFDIRDSVCRSEFGFSHGDKVMLQKPLKESGKMCIIIGVREKKLWKVDDRDTVASSFAAARSYSDLMRDHNLAVIGRSSLKEWTG